MKKEPNQLSFWVVVFHAEENTITVAIMNVIETVFCKMAALVIKKMMMTIATAKKQVARVLG